MKTIKKLGKLGIEVYVVDENVGGYTAYFEEFPKLVTQGETVDEAEQNLWNALFDILKTVL